jgi:hypothetical protein
MAVVLKKKKPVSVSTSAKVVALHAPTGEPAKVVQPIVSYPLGEGLEIWKVPIAMLKEQSVNARSMSPEAFLQLSDNITRDKRLESLPLCAVTPNGLEIISGHHRVRAARKAGIDLIWVLADITGISRDRLRAKQLAHNSLQGRDNPDLVKQIFDSIKDVEARIEAFIDPSLSPIDTAPVNLSTKDLDVQFNTRIAALAFIEPQMVELKKALVLLEKIQEVDEVFLSKKDEYDLLIATMDKASHAFNITSTPTLLAKMCEVVSAHIEPLLVAKAKEAEIKAAKVEKKNPGDK